MSKLKSFSKQIFFLLLIILAAELYQSKALVASLDNETLHHNFMQLDAESESQLIAKDSPLTLVYVFAPWCQVCQLSASTLNELQDKIPVVGLALSWGEKHNVATFKTDTGFEPPILLGTDRWASKLGVSSFPSYLIVNEQGKVIYSWVGYSTLLGLYTKAYLAKIFA